MKNERYKRIEEEWKNVVRTDEYQSYGTLPEMLLKAATDKDRRVWGYQGMTLSSRPLLYMKTTLEKHHLETLERQGCTDETLIPVISSNDGQRHYNPRTGKRMWCRKK